MIWLTWFGYSITTKIQTETSVQILIFYTLFSKTISNMIWLLQQNFSPHDLQLKIQTNMTSFWNSFPKTSTLKTKRKWALEKYRNIARFSSFVFWELVIPLVSSFSFALCKSNRNWSNGVWSSYPWNLI